MSTRADLPAVPHWSSLSQVSIALKSAATSSCVAVCRRRMYELAIGIPGMAVTTSARRPSNSTRYPVARPGWLSGAGAATPLQMQMGMGVVASGGELLRPQIIREIRDAAGEVDERRDVLRRLDHVQVDAVGEDIPGPAEHDGPEQPDLPGQREGQPYHGEDDVVVGQLA